MSTDPFSTAFVTATLPYVNAAPHLGYALEIVQADAVVRHLRRIGDDVRFATGTDENSLKSIRAAEAIGVPVERLVDDNSRRFADLAGALGVECDDFVRTSVDRRHRATAELLWRRCEASGDIYRKRYRGLFCAGCEQFYRLGDLTGGVCREHGIRPETVEEENYFFRLSRHTSALHDLVSSGRLRVAPDERRNEVLRFIEGGLEDFSISRSRERARGWGIPVPGDPSQVIFVWFDALGSYVAGLGWAGGDPLFERFWRGAGRRVHLLGKGVLRFHAVYWPAILLSAGLSPPTDVLVHGYVTVDGRKIGKSLGNAIDPFALTDRFGPDAIRYYLLRHIPTTKDANFTEEQLTVAYRSELANQLGNLVQRVTGLIRRQTEGCLPAPGAPGALERELVLLSQSIPRDVARHFRAFDLRAALETVWQLVVATNRYVDRTEPWALAKRDGARLRSVLYHAAAATRLVAGELAPFLPRAAAEIQKRLGASEDGAPLEPGVPVLHGAPLFPAV